MEVEKSVKKSLLNFKGSSMSKKQRIQHTQTSTTFTDTQVGVRTSWAQFTKVKHEPKKIKVKVSHPQGPGKIKPVKPDYSPEAKRVWAINRKYEIRDYLRELGKAAFN